MNTKSQAMPILLKGYMAIKSILYIFFVSVSVSQLVYQVVSALTGNLMLVNLLTLALSFSLLDTEHTSPAPGKRSRAKSMTSPALTPTTLTTVHAFTVTFLIQLPSPRRKVDRYKKYHRPLHKVFYCHVLHNTGPE